MTLTESPPAIRWDSRAHGGGAIPLVAVFLFIAALVMTSSTPARADGPESTGGRANVDAPGTAEEPSTDSSDDSDMEEPEAGEIEDAIDLYELDVPVMVNVNRRKENIKTLPYAATVITAEDIRRAGARTVPDALRLAPGVDVSDLTSGASAVSVRGMHGLLANTVLVLVDGRQIFDPMFGGTLWGNWPFQLEDIDRIEVIRGPAGVAWGANAATGIINIVTKDPNDQIGLTTTAGGGSRGWHKEHVGYGFKEDNLRMRVSTEYEAMDGFRNGVSILGPFDDEYKGGRVGARGIWTPTKDDEVSFSIGSHILEGGVTPTPLALGGYRTSSSNANYLQGSWDHRIDSENSTNWTFYVNDFYLDAGIPQLEYRYQQLALQFGHTFSPAENHTFTYGIDSRWDLVDTSLADPFMLTRDHVQTGTVGAYVQDQWRFAERWTLDLGARVDYDTYGGFEPSGRASLSYAPTDDSSVYGAISRAFSMPPGATRFLNLPLMAGLARVTADQDIDAQGIMAYEAGYRKTFLEKKLSFDANVFLHDYTNLTTLSPQLGPPGLIQQRFDNSGDGILYGVELDSKYKISKALTLLANYTYQQFDWSAHTSFHEKDTLYPPKHKAMVGARYDLTEQLSLNGHVYYVDSTNGTNPNFPFFKRRYDPYIRVDLNTEYRFWEDKAALQVGVRNLMDKSHAEGGSSFIHAGETERMVYAELRLSLK
ncbi:MAG: TonB-dependent receptor [Planctomycetia bacterium]|nr:TonB-dependent receptor [Planctomycetia bacterium]MCC7316243.1 TonB-dependent receptor [Planctomycetota bacterium]OQY98946.1 MAG: hypothetical protein B6D36_16870 [Planctomycetes bacterium UTPLA1]